MAKITEIRVKDASGRYTEVAEIAALPSNVIFPSGVDLKTSLGDNTKKDAAGRIISIIEQLEDIEMDIAKDGQDLVDYKAEVSKTLNDKDNGLNAKIAANTQLINQTKAELSNELNSAVSDAAQTYTYEKNYGEFTVASSDWQPSGDPVYSYQATLLIPQATDADIPDVTPDLATAAMAILAPVCKTVSGGVVIYSIEQPQKTLTFTSVILKRVSTKS